MHAHDLPAAARFVRETLKQEGVGSVAVVLLHSYANPRCRRVSRQNWTPTAERDFFVYLRPYDVY
jgi:hypothetical protein